MREEPGWVACPFCDGEPVKAYSRYTGSTYYGICNRCRGRGKVRVTDIPLEGTDESE